MAALDNAYEHGADPDEILKDRIALAIELENQYAEQAKQKVNDLCSAALGSLAPLLAAVSAPFV